MAESLQENYARGGFGKTLEPGRSPALVVIDFVRAYVQPGSPLYAGDSAVKAQAACAELLAVARAAAIPVIHTNVAYEPGGRNGGVFFRKVPALKCFETGLHPELAAFAPGLEPARRRNPDHEAVRERVLRHIAGIHAHRQRHRHRADRGREHQRLYSRQRRGCVPVRLHSAGGARGGRRSGARVRTRRTCSTCRRSTPRS